MDRVEFKQRMQQLKSYREQNPDKGYWDWKSDSAGNHNTPPNIVELISSVIQSGKDIYNYFLNNKKSTKKYKEFNIGKETYDKLKKINAEIDTTELKNIDYTLQELGYNLKQRAAFNGQALVESGINFDRKQTGGTGEGYLQITHPSRKQSLQQFKDTFDISKDSTTIDFPGKEQILWFNQVYQDELNGKHHSNEWGAGNKKTWKINFNRFADNNSSLQEVIDGLQEGYVRPNRQKAHSLKRELGTSILYNILPNFSNGGETGDKDSIVKALGEPNYSRPATEVPNNPYTGRPIATGAITTDDMETSIDMTPLGDIIAAKNLGEDLYNRQWLSAGLNALGLIPFVPNGLGKASKSMRFNTRVNRNLTSDAIDALDKRMAEYSKINSKIEKERSKINDIIKSPEAIRRIRNIDKLFGTSYDSAYSVLIRDFDALRMANDTPFIKFATPPRESTLAFIKPSEGSTIMLNKNRINNANDIYPGLTRHEMGHYVDYLAGDGITNNDYLLNLAKPSKFKPYNSLIPQFPSLSEDMYKNLRQGTEVKSYMNQFRDYLMDKGYKGNRLNLKTLERGIRNAPSTYDGTKMLFDMYKDPKQFRKDFNTIPLVNVERENTDNRYYA